MFKNKNKFAKASNILFLVFLVLSLLSIVNLLSSGYSNSEMSKTDYYINLSLMMVYLLMSSLILWITNKKVDLYKEEYPTTRKIFNLFICIYSLSIMLMLATLIINYIFNGSFSLFTLLSIIFGYIFVFTYAYIIVSKGKLLNKENSEKLNVGNLIIIYLFINYSSNIIILILQMIFNINDTILIVRSLLISLIWICVIMISYKLLNKSTN